MFCVSSSHRRIVASSVVVVCTLWPYADLNGQESARTPEGLTTEESVECMYYDLRSCTSIAPPELLDLRLESWLSANGVLVSPGSEYPIQTRSTDDSVQVFLPRSLSDAGELSANIADASIQRLTELFGPPDRARPFLVWYFRGAVLQFLRRGPPADGDAGLTVRVVRATLDADSLLTASYGFGTVFEEPITPPAEPFGFRWSDSRNEVISRCRELGGEPHFSGARVDCAQWESGYPRPIVEIPWGQRSELQRSRGGFLRFSFSRGTVSRITWRSIWLQPASLVVGLYRSMAEALTRGRDCQVARLIGRDGQHTRASTECQGVSLSADINGGRYDDELVLEVTFLDPETATRAPRTR